MPNKLQKIYFMAKKFKKDITRDRDIYTLASDIHSERLEEYYFIMTEEQMLSGHSQKYSFDTEGIPIIPTYIDIDDKKLIYYPISIGQYGLAIWNTYLHSGSDNDLDRFIKIADWFYTNRIDDQKLGSYWLTDVGKPAYKIDKPWKSAFSQARAINILLRAWQISGDSKYRNIAEKALDSFLYSVKDGGITTFTKYGPFYEEYPAEVPTLVLNGMIFSICGIYDFVRTHKNHNIATEIFERGINTLKEIISEYDLGFWSKYSLCNASFHPQVDPSTIGYHYLHIVQLKFLHRLTGEAIFAEFSEKWNNYVRLKNILRMYTMKYNALRKMKRL